MTKKKETAQQPKVESDATDGSAATVHITPPPVAGVGLPDGIYYRVDRVSNVEARLTEIEIKTGEVVAHRQSEDLSRIILGRLMQRVGANYHG